MDTDNKATPTNPTMPAPAVQATGEKKKVLVVDDEPDARELFAELLKTNPNYEIEVASDGNEALAQTEKNKPDLILLDIVMPNLDGVDTLATIKADQAKYGNPIVIMLTNIGGDIAIQEAIKLGAIGYKLKIDTEPEELLNTVAQALSGKGINSPDLSKMPAAESKVPPAMPEMPVAPEPPMPPVPGQEPPLPPIPPEPSHEPSTPSMPPVPSEEPPVPPMPAEPTAPIDPAKPVIPGGAPM